jgi:hypothetical protein
MDNDVKRNGCYILSRQDEDRQRDLCDGPLVWPAGYRERASEKAGKSFGHGQADAGIAAARVRDRQPEPAALVSSNDGNSPAACGAGRVLQQAGCDPEKYLFVEYADIPGFIMHEFEANRLVRHEFAAPFDEGMEEFYDVDGIMSLTAGPARL